MKKLLLSLSLFLLTVSYSPLFAQDILVMKNGDEIKVKVSEVMPDMVKYRKWDNQKGPVYSEPKANIFMIKYQNGSKEVFTTKETANNTTTNTDKPVRSSSAAAYTGVISLDTTQAIVSVMFKSVEDENSANAELLKNKVIDLFKSYRRLKGIRASGVDTANIALRYRIECELITFYSSTPSILNPGTTAYSADLSLSMFIFKLDKNGRALKGIPADNKLIHMKESPLGGGYISKQGAFDALIPQMDKAFKQDLEAFFPLPGTLNADNKDIETYISKTTVSAKNMDILNGTWYGDAFQKRAKYSVQLSCNFKTNEFKISYPSLGCSGSWTIEKATDNSIDFREIITAGQNSCQSGTLITVYISSDTRLEVDFYGPHSTRVIAHGTLTKE